MDDLEFVWPEGVNEKGRSILNFIFLVIFYREYLLF